MKKAMYYMTGIIILLSLTLGIMLERKYMHFRWIGIREETGNGYFLIYDGKKGPGNPEVMYKNQKFTKVYSKKTNQWTVDYYKVTFVSGVTMPSPMRFSKR